MEARSVSRKRIYLAAGVFAGALIAYNAVVSVPAMIGLSGETDATVAVYRRWLVSPNQIVFDVWRVGDTASMASIDRMLFKTADALEGRNYDAVVLASRGQARFILDGAHFKRVGQEWPDQNPVYLIRTLAENVRNLDGLDAFPAWEGGWLGVMGKQFEDHNELHMRWYVWPQVGLPDSRLGPEPDYTEAP